ncbi:hypothetical protein CANARDRAFT_30454 [[Candida] arabinofermentans NRRL YB-2248]|uniref:LSM complex subunit LSM3 n=1 Tax=[Candida] arabinofermentans NRRL YB-2248 TaxID=983967 RepID=A0A1E4SU71_9ASCO|nr:hypothetical protein CANARDRAFT_30454 [[Candida] arabinofermentans NRRL YB-2248]
MSEITSTPVPSSEPLDLIKLCLDEQIFVKLRGSREMIGKLHAYDSHCNMVLSDAVETIYYVHDSQSGEIKSKTKKSEMVFVRGDSVILVTDAANV